MNRVSDEIKVQIKSVIKPQCNPEIDSIFANHVARRNIISLVNRVAPRYIIAFANHVAYDDVADIKTMSLANRMAS